MKIKCFCLIYTFLLVISSNGYTQQIPKNSSEFSIDNQYKIEANIDGFGQMSFLMRFKKTSDSTFTASSRPKASNELVGGFKTFLGKLFTKLLKKGSFMLIDNGEIVGDSLRGIFRAPGFGLYFNGVVKDDKIVGSFGDNKYGNNEKIDWKFVATPYDSNYVAYNYTQLTEKMLDRIDQNFFNPQLLSKGKWKKLNKKLRKITPKIHDDFEYFIAFNNLAKKLNISHFGILKTNPWENKDEPQKLFHIENFNTNTTSIRFDGFLLNDSLEIRNYFDSIISSQTPNLIIDLRGCPGGDYSSMFLASYLVKQPYEAGYFIGNEYFKTHNKLPSKETIENIPDFHGKSVDEFLKIIATNGLLSGRVKPDEDLHYSGKVFLLIDNHSASASEPLAYFLKQHNLATLVGETTAGQMLSASYVDVQDGWTLQIPTADYYTSDNFRIEGKGVKSNIKVKSENALDYVLKNLIEDNNSKKK